MRPLNLQRDLSRLGLLIIDELGFVPLSPAGAGMDKERTSERVFESTLVIPGKRLKSNKRRRAAARNPQESTVPNQAEKKTAEQDGKGQHERGRSQRLGRAAYRRRNERERRQKAKECGQCRDCKNPSISGKTRCEVCAARHRMSGKQGRERKAQQKEQISVQDPIS